MLHLLPNILLVDDEPMILSSLTRLLEDEYTVFTAETGTKALEIVSGNPIQVIISDQRMPEMTGVALLRLVKKLSPQTVRILLTGYSDLEATVRSMNDAEIFRYIQKPWQAQKLLETLKLAVRVSARLEQASRITPPPERESHKSGILLLSRDKKLTSELLGIFVRDYFFYSAATVDEAYSLLRRWDIGVLLVESLAQPDETDTDALTTADFTIAIKNLHPDLVTLFVSDDRTVNEVKPLINQGRVFRYLRKPLNPNFLRDVIKDAVAAHRAFLQQPHLNLQRIEQAEQYAVDIEENDPGAASNTDLRASWNGSRNADETAPFSLTGWFSKIKANLQRRLGY